MSDYEINPIVSLVLGCYGVGALGCCVAAGPASCANMEMNDDVDGWLIMKGRKMDKEKIDELFDEIDANNDGHISAEEFKRHMKKCVAADVQQPTFLHKLID